jgi:hypothetical protein
MTRARPPAEPEAPAAPGELTQLNVRIDREVRNRAAGALRYMGPHDEAPHTMQEFTHAAFLMYLEYLERTYNDGQPFQPSKAQLTPGRRPS